MKKKNEYAGKDPGLTECSIASLTEELCKLEVYAEAQKWNWSWEWVLLFDPVDTTHLFKIISIGQSFS